MSVTYAGIDYGMGQTNRDKASGIRFGVIHQGEVLQAWADSSEAIYPDCQNPECKESGDCNCDFEPIGFKYMGDGYKAQQGGDDCDIFVTESPYFTFAQFCSPCAPGACYLMNPLSDGSENNRAFCFGHDWFDGGKAPYPVYSVETGKLVEPA